MKNKYPKHPKLFNDRTKRILLFSDSKCRIPFLIASECEQTLKAYYGSYPNAAWNIIKKWLHQTAVGYYWYFIYCFCDLIGWTKLVPFEDTGIKLRHGFKCKNDKCDDIVCVQDSVPGWFKKLTGWIDI